MNKTKKSKPKRPICIRLKQIKDRVKIDDIDYDWLQKMLKIETNLPNHIISKVIREIKVKRGCNHDSNSFK